eukprot:TRINITY_DN433_c0_g2_i1.p1 TRINITY_DN433_c0_g2~~TRINITY_DN433_c0_g2_i1.p1  ORF type:complete len:490 (+),score=100.39 TRINITY_DN433_c0_g2_i1:229-1698(+)
MDRIKELVSFDPNGRAAYEVMQTFNRKPLFLKRTLSYRLRKTPPEVKAKRKAFLIQNLITQLLPSDYSLKIVPINLSTVFELGGVKVIVINLILRTESNSEIESKLLHCITLRSSHFNKQDIKETPNCPELLIPLNDIPSATNATLSLHVIAIDSNVFPSKGASHSESTFMLSTRATAKHYSTHFKCDQQRYGDAFQYELQLTSTIKDDFLPFRIWMTWLDNKEENDEKKKKEKKEKKKEKEKENEGDSNSSEVDRRPLWLYSKRSYGQLQKCSFTVNMALNVISESKRRQIINVRTKCFCCPLCYVDYKTSVSLLLHLQTWHSGFVTTWEIQNKNCLRISMKSKEGVEPSAEISGWCWSKKHQSCPEYELLPTQIASNTSSPLISISSSSSSSPSKSQISKSSVGAPSSSKDQQTHSAVFSRKRTYQGNSLRSKVYFSSTNFMPIPVADLAYDSENELDEEWLSQRDAMVRKHYHRKCENTVIDLTIH